MSKYTLSAAVWALFAGVTAGCCFEDAIAPDSSRPKEAWVIAEGLISLFSAVGAADAVRRQRKKDAEDETFRLKQIAWGEQVEAYTLSMREANSALREKNRVLGQKIETYSSTLQNLGIENKDLGQQVEGLVGDNRELQGKIKELEDKKAAEEKTRAQQSEQKAALFAFPLAKKKSNSGPN